MPGLLAAIRSQVPVSCLKARVRKEGCNVSLEGIPKSRLIVDFDAPGSPLAPDARRCDYLLIVEMAGRLDLVSPVELKRGRIDLSEVKLQLQAGVRVAESMIPRDVDAQLIPVVASRSVSTHERITTRETVRFRNNNIPIRQIRCRQSLTKLLAN